MRGHRVFVVGLLACLGSSAAAQTTKIEHQGVACAVAERFPRLEAGLSPVEGVAIARVLFQGTGAEWYSVAMKQQGASFVGVLPKPKKGLRSFRYYIEVTDKALGTTRTPEFSTNVIESSGACKGGILAGALGSASVVLQGPAGIVAIPGGFASTGVVAGSAAGSTAGASGAAAAGGGGLSTGAVVGIVGGVAAAGAGVAAVVASKGGESEDAAISYSGPVSGQYTVTQTVVGNVTNVCSFLRSLNGAMRVTLRQGSASPGDAQLDVTESSISVSGGCGGSGPACCGQNTFTCVLTGTSGSLACSEQRTFTPSPGFSNTRSFTFSGSLSAGVISGVVTYGITGQGAVNISTETFAGSTSFAVTLR